MRDVLVRRLSLRVPSGHLAASRQRAEEGLFLAAPDETRLVLLRRLDLGRLSPRASADAWVTRAAERLAERRARAVHGSQPGAEAADAVWFRSIDEARELLMRVLAAGRPSSAWFWRLAVPEWRGLPLPLWLEERVAAALAEPAAEVALARAVIATARLGELPAVAHALASARLPELPAPAQRHVTASALPVGGDAAPLAPVLLARLDAATRHAVLRVVAALPARGPHARWLARLTLVAVAPELAGHGAMLAELAERVVAETHARIVPGTDVRPAQANGSSAAIHEAADGTPAARVRDAAPRPRRSSLPLGVTASPPVRELPAHHTPSAAPSSTRPLGRPPDAPAEPVSESATHGAGVLLVIRALDRLGLGARLDDDADAAVSAFGRHLLRHIAARARVAPDDALFALLTAPDPPPRADALHAWRVGLDRWLRRRVRLRLSDVACRWGWLQLTDTTLLVRFPLDAADIRLRRLGLDSDPCWVPWLGLDVRYRFRDAPLG